MAQGRADYFTKARGDCFRVAIPFYDRLAPQLEVEADRVRAISPILRA